MALCAVAAAAAALAIAPAPNAGCGSPAPPEVKPWPAVHTHTEVEMAPDSFVRFNKTVKIDYTLGAYRSDRVRVRGECTGWACWTNSTSLWKNDTLYMYTFADENDVPLDPPTCQILNFPFGVYFPDWFIWNATLVGTQWINPVSLGGDQTGTAFKHATWVTKFAANLGWFNYWQADDGTPLRISAPNRVGQQTFDDLYDMTEHVDGHPAGTFDLIPGVECKPPGPQPAPVAAGAPHAADLLRARQRVPRAAWRGGSPAAAMGRLNAHLAAQAATRPCDEWAPAELHRHRRRLYAARSPELAGALAAGDKRHLPYGSAAALEADWRAEAAALLHRDTTHAEREMGRDGLCHEVVMLYAHHLAAPARAEYAAAHGPLPALPADPLPPPQQAGRGIAARYGDRTGCLACHVDFKNQTAAA